MDFKMLITIVIIKAMEFKINFYLDSKVEIMDFKILIIIMDGFRIDYYYSKFGN